MVQSVRRQLGVGVKKIVSIVTSLFKKKPDLGGPIFTPAEQTKQRGGFVSKKEVEKAQAGISGPTPAGNIQKEISKQRGGSAQRGEATQRIQEGIISEIDLKPIKKIDSSAKAQLRRRGTVGLRNILDISLRSGARQLQRGAKAFDIVSGGLLTERSLSKKQSGINTEIESYNRRFGNRELQESEFRAAERKAGEIEQRQREINQQRVRFERSPTAKIRDYVWGTGALTKNYNFDKALSKNKKDLRDVQRQKRNAQGKTGLISKINNKRLDVLERGLKTERKNLKARKVPVILTGDVPLTPAIGIPRNVNIRFIGTQRYQGNKILTDIAFTTNKGRVGVARGVTIQKGSRGFTITAGRSGVAGVKFPTGRGVIGRKESFIGFERSVVKPSSLKVKDTIKLLNRGRSSGQISVIRNNIKTLRQLGVGKMASVRGEKFIRTGIRFPTGKIARVKARGITTDDFASLSHVLTKKDISLIIGKTITGKRSQAQFIGLIKGTSRAGTSFRVSGSKQIQFRRALQRVISVAAASLSQTKSIPGITKAAAITMAGIQTQKVVRAAASPRAIQRAGQISRTRQAPTRLGTGQIQAARPRQRGRPGQLARSNQQVQQRTRQVLRELSVQKSRQEVKQIVRQSSLSRSKLRQGLRMISQQKLAQKQITNLKRIGIRMPPFRVIPIIGFKGRSKAKRISGKREAPGVGYNVYGKARGRYIKLNKRPLKERDALSRGAWAIDHSTARTYKIKSAGRVKRFGSIRRKEKGYVGRTGRKFRSFRIRGGRKVALTKKYIEKRRYLIDTQGEKRGLTLSRLARREGFIGRSRPARSSRKRSSGFLSRYRPRRSSARHSSRLRRSFRSKRSFRPRRSSSVFSGGSGFFYGTRRRPVQRRSSSFKRSSRRSVSRPHRSRSHRIRRRSASRSRPRRSRSLFDSSPSFFR